MSKLITSFGSISKGGGNPNLIHLAFSGWGEGPIFSWYNGLDLRAKSIQNLQIWKDITGAVPHRFIVLHMSNDRTHRFDRRPDRGPESDANTVGLLTNQAVASKDTCMLNIDPSSLEQSSLCEIELTLSGQVDLLTVISACYAISNDDSTREYTFLRHNCFFFSWAILMVVSRHYLPYDVPPHDSIVHRFQSQLGRLTAFIVGEAIALFLELFTEVVTIFRNNAGKSLHQGQNLFGRAVWSLPNGFLRFFLRQLFTARLHFGLRDQLNKKVKAKLETIASPVYSATLSEHMTRDTLDAHLWIEETKDTVREGLRKEIMKILWESILEVISSGLGNIGTEELAAQQTDTLKFSLLGKNVAQFCAVWNGALHGGLQAAKRVGEDVKDLSHEEAFECTWSAVRGGALIAAQTVVKSTSVQMNNPQRDRMWESIWKIWDKTWGEAHSIAQPRAIRVVEKIVEELLDAAVGVVINDMRESEVKTIQACMPKEHKWLRAHRKVLTSMTNATLQEHMQNIIKKDTVNTEALRAVHSSMERVWKKARQHLPIPVTPLDTIAELD